MIRAALLLLAACGRDVYLGELEAPAPDAQVDAAIARGPFLAGTYGIAFLDPQNASCMDALAGREADFATITRASLGLVDGSITLATPDTTTLVVTGSPIADQIGQSSIALVPDTGDPLWTGQVDGAFATGPDATRCQSIAFAADSSTATATSGVEAAIAFLYASTDGECSIDFRALLTKS